MREELEPCPFCGGEAELMHIHAFSEQSYIICLKCGARTREFRISTERSSDQEAIEAWNRRTEE